MAEKLHTCLAVISGFAKEDRGLASEHVHSMQLACCNQLFTIS